MAFDVTKELSQNFIDFCYEANSERAFPDARDGLKPGQRACLWEMYTKGYLSNKPHVKSAKISGGVIASWWPHGDVAIYETFARMSQPWINNIPEVDWHGNNGNIVIGNEPASSRYTEARLSKVIEEGMFQGIKKNNVPMIPNFSEDDEWPAVLPAVLPRLLINGSQGIGVTIANTWLPGNLKEIYEVIKKYIETGDVDTKNIYPDFPSGGIIINKNDIHTIYETGKGKAIVRAKTEIKGNNIFITELPYQVYVEALFEDIKKLIQSEELTGIKNLYNKTDKKKLLIEIECDENPEAVLKKLFKLTDLQKSFSANQWALIGKTPKLLTLKDYVQIYIKHNLECNIKEYQFDLNKAKAREEIVGGLLKALEDIDNIVALIKASESAAAAKQNLINKYSFTDAQAKAIVDMKLGRLANLEKIELQKEEEELKATIENILSFLSSKEKQEQLVLSKLATIVKKYGDARKTELTHIEIPKEEKVLETVEPEDCVVFMSQSGDVKRIPAKSFKVQNRNGKGVKSEDDAVLDIISTNTIDTLMVFTDKGKMYRILVDALPVGTNTSKGVRIGTLINMEPNEKVMAITSLYRKSAAEYVVFITKQGLFKKTLLSEYTSVKRSVGVQAIKLKEGDEIANVTFCNEEEFIVITKQGMSIRFETNAIAPIGRATSGVKSIKLGDGDEVLVGLPIHKTTDSLAVFTKSGYGKKTALDEFPVQGRAGKGIKCSGDCIIGATLISDEDNILVGGVPNSICVSAKDIPALGRISVGNAIIKNSIMKKVVKL